MQGVVRTALVAAATPLMFLVISWIASAIAPPTLPDGTYTYSSAAVDASAGDYVGWIAGFAMYLGFATFFATMIGAVIGLALGLIGAALDAVTVRRLPPAVIAVAVTLSIWVGTLAVTQSIGQQNWVTEDFGQVFVSSPFVLGLVSLAVVPIVRRRPRDLAASTSPMGAPAPDGVPTPHPGQT